MTQRPSSLDEAVAAFGAAATSKLSAVSVQGEPEDQLRNPLEILVADLARLAGLDPTKLLLVGESSLAEMHTRPDFAVSYDNALARASTHCRPGSRSRCWPRGRTGGHKPKLTARRQVGIARQMYDEKGADGKRRYTVAEIAETFHVARKTICRHLEPHIPAPPSPPV